MIDLTGIPVRTDSNMENSKTAVLSGGILYVSPAMLTLIKYASEDGTLEELLNKIPLLNLDVIGMGMSTQLPFTVETPDWDKL